MNGAFARSGFRYQDLYLLHRLLGYARDVCRDAWALGTPDLLAMMDQCTTEFGIEAAVIRELGQPPWDVTVTTATLTEVIEVKSGAITKADRGTLWRRLRRTRAVSGGSLAPVLVVDPETDGSLEKWDEFTSVAREAREVPPAPAVVHTAQDLIDESLHWLCNAEADATCAPMSPATAREMLARFQIVRYRADQLAADVDREIGLLFPDGMTDTLRRNIRDWLDERGANSNRTPATFRLGDMFRALGMVRDAMALERGALQKWKSQLGDWRALVARNAPGTIGAGGQAVSIEKAQPAVTAALAGGGNGTLLLGGAGFGKSTLLMLLDRARSAEGLLCPAASLSIAEIDDLAAAVSFRAAFTQGAEKVSVLVDGLDEVELPNIRQRWGQVLARLATRSSVDVVATMREADWQSDPLLRTQLNNWREISLQEWSEDLVRSLLAQTQFAQVVPPSLLSLLRTPIMLDLFWRTFVEVASNAPAQLPVTRHQLLVAFWKHRIVRGRHAPISKQWMHIQSVFEAAAGTVSPFSINRLDTDAVNALCSESVLVHQGTLRPRLQFRHPLLRDFALALWCLDAGDTDAVAVRWFAIKGGLPRQGVLRALLEALTDTEADSEFPEATVASLVSAVVSRDSSQGLTIARALGGIAATARSDPAEWPENARALLPKAFGAELVGSARRFRNPSWAAKIPKWSLADTWIDAGLAGALIEYLQQLRQVAGQRPGDASWHEAAVTIARTVRQLSEDERFSATFEERDRWTRHLAIEAAAPLLREAATLNWIERELPKASRFSRSAILSVLPTLASIEPRRAAAIYKDAIGLVTRDGRPALDGDIWNQNFEYDALDRCLTGPGGGVPSLVSRFPEAFLPIAVELDEALHHGKTPACGAEDAQLRSLLEELYGPRPPRPSPECDPLVDLIDDHHFYQSRQDRVEAAIRELVRQTADAAAEQFAMLIFPILRRSRLASHHAVILSALEERAPASPWLPLAVECLRDRRIYHVPGLLEPLETVLTANWPGLSQVEREAVLGNIDSMAMSPYLHDGERARAYFLSGLPAADLSGKHREVAEIRQAERPRQRRSVPETLELESESSPVSIEDMERWIGEWPANFDRSLLREFYVAASRIGEAARTDNVRAALPEALALMARIVPVLAFDPEVLASSGRLWMWDALVKALYAARMLPEPSPAERGVSERLLRDCAKLAQWHLVGYVVHGREPSTENSHSLQENPWTGALELATEILVHPPLSADAALNTWFGEQVEKAFLGASAEAQVEVVARLFPAYWLRIPRLRNLTTEALWTHPTHAAPIIRALSLLQYLPDAERVQAARLVLSRSNLTKAKDLAESLGEVLGHGSMWLIGGQRTALAAFADKVLANRAAFPLLLDDECWRTYLYHFAFGLKEAAKCHADQIDFSHTFARWNIRAWHEMRRLPETSHESTDSIGLFALYWLGRNEAASIQIDVRRHWWRQLHPLCELIIDEGSAQDVFHFFFYFHGGQFNDIASADEILTFVKRALDRLEPVIARGEVCPPNDLDAAPKHWRQGLKAMAQAVESLIKDSWLTDEARRESAHAVLERLTAAPLDVAEAKDPLHRLLG